MKSGTFSKQNFMTIVILFSILTSLINICLKRSRMEPHAASSRNLSICHEVWVKRRGLKTCHKGASILLISVLGVAGFSDSAGLRFSQSWLQTLLASLRCSWKSAGMKRCFAAYCVSCTQESRGEVPFSVPDKDPGPFWPRYFKRWREGKALASNPSAVWETSNHIPGYSDQWHTEATGLR